MLEIDSGFWVLKYLLHLFGEFDLHLACSFLIYESSYPRETLLQVVESVVGGGHSVCGPRSGSPDLVSPLLLSASGNGVAAAPTFSSHSLWVVSPISAGGWRSPAQQLSQNARCRFRTSDILLVRQALYR